MSRKVERVSVCCPTCGEAFETTEQRIAADRGKFCSKACSARMNSTKHGHTTHSSLSKTYTTWSMMIQRCRNPNATKYPRYGALGIDVCERWNQFHNFLEDMGPRPEGLTLDRKNNELGYSKENCRWATLAEQAANKRPRGSVLPRASEATTQ